MLNQPKVPFLTNLRAAGQHLAGVLTGGNGAGMPRRNPKLKPTRLKYYTIARPHCQRRPS